VTKKVVGVFVAFSLAPLHRSGFNPNSYVDLNDPYLAKDDYSVNNLGVEVGAVYKFKSFQIALAPAASQENGNYREYRSLHSL
jgi:hypothetical protein